MLRKPLFFVLTGPSGAGKSTIIKHLVETMPDLGCPVSHTSRAPRATETDGVEYFFRSPEEMNRMQTQGAFLESSTTNDGTMYGLSKFEIRRMRKYQSAVLDLDVAGGRALKDALGDAVTLVMVTPEYGDELVTRLKKRGTESTEAINQRLARAVDELSASGDYDYLIINRSEDEAVAQLRAIIQAEHLSLKRQKNEEVIWAVMEDLQGEI